jgi:hypothetical protein
MQTKLTVELTIDVPDVEVISRDRALQEICDKLYVGAEHHPDDYCSVRDLQFKMQFSATA